MTSPTNDPEKLVAVVAVVALPLNVVAVTVPNPAIFVSVPPNDTADVPNVMLPLPTNALLGIDVRPEPLPVNVVADTEVKLDNAVIDVPNDTAVDPIVIELLARFALAMAPANIVFVIVPTPVVYNPFVTVPALPPIFNDAAVPLKFVPVRVGAVVQVGVAPDVAACNTPAAFVTNDVVPAAD